MHSSLTEKIVGTLKIRHGAVTREKSCVANKEKNMFNQYDQHELITTQMSAVYRAKNADYGDSFHKSHVKHGAIAALVRMDDKLQRVSNLLLSGDLVQVKDEAVEDTLLDLANYAVMLIVELRRAKAEVTNV